MEKRIGIITNLTKGKTAIPVVNTLLSEYSSIILARQGLTLHNRNISVISLIEGAIPDKDQTNSILNKDLKPGGLNLGEDAAHLRV